MIYGTCGGLACLTAVETRSRQDIDGCALQALVVRALLYSDGSSKK